MMTRSRGEAGFDGVGRIAQATGDALGITLAKEKFDETHFQEWPDMDTRQRAGAVGAFALTIARPAYEVGRIIQNLPDDERAWGETIVDGVMAAMDKADGSLATATGGKTAFGGVADQLMGDKATFWLREIDMARRGRFSWIHPALRITRDGVVTWARQEATRRTDGAAQVNARSANHPLSGKWSTADRFTTNILLDSPLGLRMPRTARESVASAATLHVLASGVANLYDLQRESQEY